MALPVQKVTCRVKVKVPTVLADTSDDADWCHFPAGRRHLQD